MLFLRDVMHCTLVKYGRGLISHGRVTVSNATGSGVAPGVPVQYRLSGCTITHRHVCTRSMKIVYFHQTIIFLKTVDASSVSNVFIFF